MGNQLTEAHRLPAPVATTRDGDPTFGRSADSATAAKPRAWPCRTIEHDASGVELRLQRTELLQAGPVSVPLGASPKSRAIEAAAWDLHLNDLALSRVAQALVHPHVAPRADSCQSCLGRRLEVITKPTTMVSVLATEATTLMAMIEDAKIVKSDTKIIKDDERSHQ